MDAYNRRRASSVSSSTSARSQFQLRRDNSIRGGLGAARRASDEVEVTALFDSSSGRGRRDSDATTMVSDDEYGESEYRASSGLMSSQEEENHIHEDEEERQSNWELVDRWKERRMKLAGGLNYVKSLWQGASLSRAVYDGLHEVTVLGDFLFERYFHFWQILRNTHFAKILPSVLITRIFFRGIYLMVVGTRKDDFYPFEWKIRRDINRSFRLEQSKKRSYFYTFYVDILIELVFIAFISKANNATFNRALTARLRNWQWLFLGVASLALCVVRDIRLTLFNLDPNTLHEKTQNIIHTIGTLIIALCDIIMIITFLYIIILHLVLSWHDIEIYRRIQETAHDNDVEGEGLLRDTSLSHLSASATIQEEEDSSLHKTNQSNQLSPSEAIEQSDHQSFTHKSRRGSESDYAQQVEAVVVDGNCSACLPNHPYSDDPKRTARLDACKARRERRRAFRYKIRMRAVTAARNFRTVINQRVYAPDYLFREADQRSLLTALLHPPGSCAGLFTADDLQAKDDKFVQRELAKHHPDASMKTSWLSYFGFSTVTSPPKRLDRPSLIKSSSSTMNHSDGTTASTHVGSVGSVTIGQIRPHEVVDEAGLSHGSPARYTRPPPEALRRQSSFYGKDVKKRSRHHHSRYPHDTPEVTKAVNKSDVSTHHKIARTVTHTLFGGLFTQPVPGAYQLSTLSAAQKRALTLPRLHLNERVDEAWQHRVRKRSYHIHARLWMACIMGWLLAVAATAGLGYGAWALENYMQRRLEWIDDQITDVRALLDSFLALEDINATGTSSDALLQSVQLDLSEAIDTFADDTKANLVSAATSAVEEAVESLAESVNSTRISDLLKNNTSIEDAVRSVANETRASFSQYETTVATQAAAIIVDYLERYYEYVVDYEKVLRTWLRLARRATRNTFKSGIVGSGIAFVLMNYSLLMTVARFREATLRFRETGMIDDMDLLIDESLQEPATRSEWFWIVMTAPSAPYAVAFVGMAVSNMLIISIMVMLVGFIITGASLFPGAMSTTRIFLATHIGDWYIIYPIIYCLDWFYLNAFIADRTYIIHRGCFDLWDFILGTWKLVTGLFGGILRLILIYLIATMNTIRIDWTIFTGRIGWLDIGYNAFASAVMLTERHVSPTLLASSRLLLSAAPEAYGRRTCAEHVLIFDVAARSRVLSAAHDARDLPDLFERVLMEDQQALSVVQRARVGLAWRILHLLWVLAANPSLVTWNVKKWREHPISFATWRRARDRLRKRRERDLKKRRASAILEVADRELHNEIDTSATMTPPTAQTDKRKSLELSSPHRGLVSNIFSTSMSTSNDSQHGPRKPQNSTRSMSSSRRSASPPRRSRRKKYLVNATNFIFPNAMGSSASSTVRARRRGASVIDRIDRLEAVIDERLPEQRLREDASYKNLDREQSFGSPRRRRGSGNDFTTDVHLPGEPDAEREAIVAEPEEVAGVLTQFQLGYLRTTFRLFDKDHDELVTVSDLKIHYNSQGLVLSDQEARSIIDTVSVVRKGYYTTQRSESHTTADNDDESSGFSLDLHEVERYGFDFPEFLAYLIWRLKEEEALAFLLGVSSGLYLDDKRREAALQTAFVRFKGYDERAIDVNDHLQRPLRWVQFKSLIKRTRLDRGPFGLHAAESRLLFDLLCLGAKAGDFEPNIETLVSKECGPFFASNDKSIFDQDAVDFDTVSAFYDSSIFGRAGRLHLRDLKDNMTETSSVTEMDLNEAVKLAASSHLLGDAATRAEAAILDIDDDEDDEALEDASITMGTAAPHLDATAEKEADVQDESTPADQSTDTPAENGSRVRQDPTVVNEMAESVKLTREARLSSIPSKSVMQLDILTDDDLDEAADEAKEDVPVTGLDDFEDDVLQEQAASLTQNSEDDGAPIQPLQNA